MANRLEIFLNGVASVCEKLGRGWKTRSAIECVVLSAVIIDGFLRIGLILKQQIDTCSSDIDESLLYQSNVDTYISERSIIKRCYNKKVISEKLYKDINDAYNRRNKCVHRYLISDINYSYITRLVFDYADLIDKVKEAVENLETEQIQRGIGMVETADIPFPFLKDIVKKMAKQKDERPNFDG